MEVFASLTALIPAISALDLLMTVFLILFMHYSAKHRNHQLSVGWYICGFLFGIWTLIVFLIKRKDFPGPKTKVCYQCGRKYPDSFQMCSNCLIELPVINAEEKEKQRKLAKGFGIGVIVTHIAVTVVIAVLCFVFFSGVIDEVFSMNDRIAVNGVYYDKEGNSYENEDDVLLYDEEGKVYTYTEVEVKESDYELMAYTDYYYVRDDGKKYSVYDCYVTEDGWFYCDRAYELESWSPDTDSMSEEELDAYYQESLEMSESEYRYYDYKYTDSKGNIYYKAYEASWNEKGELITAENDPSAEQ